MKILYAFQGTGNGHISRAMEIIPCLQSYAKVHVLMSGTKVDLELPFKIKHKFKGLSYQLDDSGGIDLLNSYKKASLKTLWKDIRTVPIEKYDLVINDFEPITAWACRFRNKLSVSLSHQAAVLAPEAPKPAKKDLKGLLTLKVYAPCKINYGLHFYAYNDHIHTPVISKEIREKNHSTGDHVTVYLPSYSEASLLALFAQYPQINWEVFTNTCPLVRVFGHIKTMPLDRQSFIHSMRNAYAVICGAGFETPAEAIYMGKRLAVVPTKHQYEQSCNAAALSELGIQVWENVFSKQNDIEGWLSRAPALKINYSDQTDMIITKVLEEVEQNIFTTIPALYYSKLDL